MNYLTASTYALVVTASSCFLLTAVGLIVQAAVYFSPTQIRPPTNISKVISSYSTNSTGITLILTMFALDAGVSIDLDTGKLFWMSYFSFFAVMAIHAVILFLAGVFFWKSLNIEIHGKSHLLISRCNSTQNGNRIIPPCCLSPLKDLDIGRTYSLRDRATAFALGSICAAFTILFYLGRLKSI